MSPEAGKLSKYDVRQRLTFVKMKANAPTYSVFLTELGNHLLIAHRPKQPAVSGLGPQGSLSKIPTSPPQRPKAVSDVARKTR